MTRTNYRGVEVDVTVHPDRDTLLTPFGKQTLKDRYVMPGESPQDVFARVAAYYSDNSEMAQRVYDAISKLWFMPSTPILSNGGTDRGLPISCFLNAVPDSMEGIRDTWSENVDLASNGGGIGTYWGDVRSKAEKIKGRGETSGVIPFIKVMDSLTLAVSQGSLRRGSAAVYIDIHHPEIEEFLEFRKPSGDPNRRCLNIHHGVNITDKFMEAVDANGSFDLISPKDGSIRKTVSARNLWQKILETRLATGEPYILFIDTVNRNRPEVYRRNNLFVRQSNLCSEIALATGMDRHGRNRTAVCCLASLNAYTSDEWFGNVQFLKDVAIFQDNVLEDFIRKTEGKAGFENARYAASMERSIGIGMMGFVSYLQKNNILFESAIAQGVNMRLWKWLAKAGAEINQEVALERGACPDAHSVGLMQRWSHMFSIAPTASISIICGGVSPCMEHFTANVFSQKTLSGTFEVWNPVLEERIRWYADQTFDQFIEDDFSQREGAKDHWIAEVRKSIMENAGSVQHLPFLSDHDKELYRTWEETDQLWVVEHAAKRAPYIDQMASNNIFLPPNVHKRDLHNIHMKAWRDGVPSLYYLRSRSILNATAPKHLAGEMPQPTEPHDVTLVDRGPAVGPLYDDSKYETCLSCQ